MLLIYIHSPLQLRAELIFVHDLNCEIIPKTRLWCLDWCLCSDTEDSWNNPQSCHVSFLHTGAEIRRAYSSLESETSDESSIHGWFRVLFWRLGGFPCRTVTSTSWSMWQPWAWWCEGRWSTSCGGISNCTMWMEMAALTDTSSSTS